ncbi:guanitoxin biosynthesis MBL fold metallo-hydrolase GntH [Methanosarcina sp. Mfa9]|uniref:guanitoxin biosynthesis MBL fold metallo-hydrolase GntH n=1 Tax=Methanosarcina sp. Mfa9 TaxID=3439063 RepID=UPI003F87DAA4
MEMPVNPYGGTPGGGITLPPYFRPTPSVGNRNNYYPNSEKLGPDEMRISFIGSCPFPPRRNQAGTCIMVELGDGQRFFFDFGPGCVKNILGMAIPVQVVNDIFITHLHIDHYHDLSYLLPFSAWAGRWKPLRVHGPSGRTPELGTRAMVEGMKKMLKWHLEAFDACPIGDGYEVEVNEFDWKDENGICYDKNGVTIRHWRRSHAKDGASAYRLDWNGLSFVWTGDGRADELTAKYSKNVDVFVTECQTDIGNLVSLKYGIPDWLYNYTIDIHHTPHYAAGHLMKEVNPRIGMVTHMEYDESTVNEVIAGIRAHWDGLFVFGAPDVMVVNVTKDAIWARKAVIPEDTGMSQPDPAELFKGKIPKELEIPKPRIPREDQQEQYTRDLEIDPKIWYPPDVFREPFVKIPEGMKVDLEKMTAARKKPNP